MGLEALTENGHKFQNLQYIELKNNEITDVGLEALAVNGQNFQNLQEVWLGYNQISDVKFIRVKELYEFNFSMY